MKAAFVDTAGWMMLADAGDPAHRAAVQFRDKWLREKGVFVSTDFVMDETLTLLRVRLGIDAAEEWWNQVEGSARLSWEWIDPARAEKARRWLFRWRDKAFSFTDCTSFVVMKERRLRTALTSNHHFVQAGFEIAPGVEHVSADGPLLRTTAGPGGQPSPSFTFSRTRKHCLTGTDSNESAHSRRAGCGARA